MQQSVVGVASEQNPFVGEETRLKQQAAEEEEYVAAVQQRCESLTSQVAWLGEVDTAFGRTGIQNFVLEGLLGELQVGANIISMMRPYIPVHCILFVSSDVALIQSCRRVLLCVSLRFRIKM